MSTEILGYMGQFQRTAEKTTESHTEPRKTKGVHITNAVKSKLLGVILIALGALSIPVCEGDGTAFIMLLFFGISAMIGGNKND